MSPGQGPPSGSGIYGQTLDPGGPQAQKELSCTQTRDVVVTPRVVGPRD